MNLLQINKELKNLKPHLPDGSYAVIAKRIGKRTGTVATTFSTDTSDRISLETKQKILNEAMKITERNSWNGLEKVYGEATIKQLKLVLKKQPPLVTA